MKVNFELELILKMVNEEGKMLKDIQEYYKCSRGQLSWFLRKHNLNFKNNSNARKNQSNLMKTSVNPTKGKKRSKKEMDGISKANRLKAEKEWDVKFKEGITYQQYCKISRQRAYSNMNKKSKK